MFNVKCSYKKCATHKELCILNIVPIKLKMRIFLPSVYFRENITETSSLNVNKSVFSFTCLLD